MPRAHEASTIASVWSLPLVTVWNSRTTTLGVCVVVVGLPLDWVSVRNPAGGLYAATLLPLDWVSLANPAGRVYRMPEYAAGRPCGWKVLLSTIRAAVSWLTGW